MVDNGDQYNRWLFASAINRQEGWLRTALELKRSASVLWDSYYPEHKSSDAGLISAYMLLAGLATENLIKGVLIKEKPENIIRQDGTLYPNHDLVRFFDYAGIPVNEESEKPLLKRLTFFVVWRARYPVPTKSSGFQPDKETYAPMKFFSYDDHSVFQELFDRVLTRYSSEVCALADPFDYYGLNSSD